MSMWRDLQDVMKMVSEGGLQVVTLIPELEGGAAVFSLSSTYQGKIYDQRGIRTTIQFDSDYITTISPEVLAMPELWQRHTDVLREKLSILKKTQFWVGKSWLLFLIYPVYTVIFALMTEGFPGEWLSLTSGAHVGMAMGLVAGAAVVLARKLFVRLLRVLLLPPVLWAARWYAQRRFQQFISMPAAQG